MDTLQCILDAISLHLQRNLANSEWKTFDKSLGLNVGLGFKQFNALFVFLLLFSCDRLIGTVIQCNVTYPSCTTFIARFYMGALIMQPLLCIPLEFYTCLQRMPFSASLDIRNAPKFVQRITYLNDTFSDNSIAMFIQHYLFEGFHP